MAFLSFFLFCSHPATRNKVVEQQRTRVNSGVPYENTTGRFSAGSCIIHSSMADQRSRLIVTNWLLPERAAWQFKAAPSSRDAISVIAAASVSRTQIWFVRWHVTMRLQFVELPRLIYLLCSHDNDTGEEYAVSPFAGKSNISNI